jgi:hypothetical protein
MIAVIWFEKDHFVTGIQQSEEGGKKSILIMLIQTTNAPNT